MHDQSETSTGGRIVSQLTDAQREEVRQIVREELEHEKHGEASIQDPEGRAYVYLPQSLRISAPATSRGWSDSDDGSGKEADSAAVSAS